MTTVSLRARHQPPGRRGASAPSARFAFVDASGGLVAVPGRRERRAGRGSCEMDDDFLHLPVMAAEVIELLAAVPTGPGRGRDGGWRWPRPGAPDRPARPRTPRHRPGSRRRGSGGRGARTLRGPGPHRAGRLRAHRRNRRKYRHRGKRGNRGDLVRPGRQQPAARPSGAGLLVLGRRRAARHADGQRADADRGDGRERVLRGRPRRAHRPQRRGALRPPHRVRDRRRPPAADDR